MIVWAIDAWSDGDDGWVFNDRYQVDNISKADFEMITRGGDKMIAEWFLHHGHTNTADLRKIKIDDDGHYVLLLEKKGGMPLFAIEYGGDY